MNTIYDNSCTEDRGVAARALRDANVLFLLRAPLRGRHPGSLGVAARAATNVLFQKKSGKNRPGSFFRITNQEQSGWIGRLVR